MNKTEKDFQREITRLKQSYMDDQIKYELPFKHEKQKQIHSKPFSSATNDYQR
jgi:hypothetical protein